MFLIRGRSKSRPAVAPCPPTAAPSASTSTSFSFRTSSIHSTSSSLPTGRPSLPSLCHVPTMTDGWVCDPAISALHFSYALTQAAEDEEADTDRCELQSPRPNQSHCESPVSFLSLDGIHPPKPAIVAAATVPTKYRRVSDVNQTDTLHHSPDGEIEPKPSPNSHTTKANTSTSPGVTSGSGRRRDWLQSSLGRLAFRRRSADECTSTVQSDVVQVQLGSEKVVDKSVQPSVLQTRKLSTPLPSR